MEIWKKIRVGVFFLNTVYNNFVLDTPFSRNWRIYLENSLFPYPIPLLDTTSKGTPCDVNVIYTPLISTFNGLKFSRWQYSFV